MLGAMRLPLVILATLALGGVAHADGLQLSAGAPASGLPAVSADGAWYARPVHVQPADCKGGQIFVELGNYRTDKSDLLLVADDCSSTSSKVAAKNLETLNKTLADGKFRSAGKVVGRAFGDLDVEGRKVSVATSGNNVIVSTGKTDRWSVTLEGKPIEVRGWYGGKRADGKAFVSIAVAVQGKELGPRGRERWLDFVPTEQGGGAAGQDSALEVANSWLEAMRKKDARGLAELMSTPFWKVGLTASKACKRKQSAGKQRQVRGVADCIAGAVSQVYLKYTSPDTLSEIELAEMPDELRKHKKKVAKMLRGGDKLVRYYVNDDDLYVSLILVLDAGTDYQTVQAALEFIDAGNVTENY
jgi:hypothetical protein